MGYMPIFCLSILWQLQGEEQTLAGMQTQLENLLVPVVESLGCVLWGLDYQAQGKKSLLRIYIDKPGGVVLEDCERVSRQAGSVLDVEDPILGEYVLEVSSPGMDRSLYKLNQYAGFVGEAIAIKLRMPFDGRRKFTGVLVGVENEEIVLRVDDEEYVLPYELIDKANLVPSF